MSKMSHHDAEHAGAQYAAGFVAGLNHKGGQRPPATGAFAIFFDEGFDDSSLPRKGLSDRDPFHINNDSYTDEHRAFLRVLRGVVEALDARLSHNETYACIMRKVAEVKEEVQDRRTAERVARLASGGASE